MENNFPDENLYSGCGLCQQYDRQRRFQHLRQSSRPIDSLRKGRFSGHIKSKIWLLYGTEFLVHSWLLYRRLRTKRRRAHLAPTCREHRDVSSGTVDCAGKWQTASTTTTCSRWLGTTAGCVILVVTTMSGRRRDTWRPPTLQICHPLRRTLVDAVAAGRQSATWSIVCRSSLSWYCFSAT